MEKKRKESSYGSTYFLLAFFFFFFFFFFCVMNDWNIELSIKTSVTSPLLMSNLLVLCSDYLAPQILL